MKRWFMILMLLVLVMVVLTGCGFGALGGAKEREEVTTSKYDVLPHTFTLNDEDYRILDIFFVEKEEGRGYTTYGSLLLEAPEGKSAKDMDWVLKEDVSFYFDFENPELSKRPERPESTSWLADAYAQWEDKRLYLLPFDVQTEGRYPVKGMELEVRARDEKNGTYADTIRLLVDDSMMEARERRVETRLKQWTGEE